MVVLLWTEVGELSSSSSSGGDDDGCWPSWCATSASWTGARPLASWSMTTSSMFSCLTVTSFPASDDDERGY